MAGQKRRSRYDELHDKYHRILTTKAGTRYERLAAMVFKALEDRNTVIHDLKLSGEDPEVKHQIDVTVEAGGVRRRMLIECKDFDSSGDKVGLDVIRSFRSVVEDTKADEAVVITCNGFTEDAQRYARSKRIKLAILRVFETRDMEGRIAKIVVGITVIQPANPRADLYMTEASRDRLAAEMIALDLGLDGFRNSDPVYAVRDSAREQISAFLTRRMNEAIRPGGPKVLRVAVPSDGWAIQVAMGAPIPFDGVVVEFDVDEERVTFDVTSQRIAELILSGFGPSDLIIFGDQIERRKIDPETGEVG